MRFPRSLGIALAIGLGSTLPAQAGFRACNETQQAIGLAIAYSDGKAWISEGWKNMSAKSCIVVFDGALRARFYYLRAVDFAGGAGAATGRFARP
jgi:uncharacterized membrane protein